ncbi:MAG: hypothetical protein PW792_16815 [Acidobacteriaceae bacterium]|nr:hypothetical protein [Acidobacteriaceae bacterium]
MLRSLFVRVGCVVAASAVVLMTGCSSDQPVSPASVTTATLAAGGAANIFSINYTSSTANTVMVTSLTNGTTTSLAVPAGFEATSVAFDSTNAVMYLGGVTTASAYEVLAYPAASSSLLTPTRTIVSSGVFSEPDSMAVDATGQLYVMSSLGVSVFPLTANGTPTPTQSLTTTGTALVSPVMLAVDSAKNIYVVDATTQTSTVIEVFAAGSTGAVAPTRTITYAAGYIYGIAVDSSLNLYAAEETQTSAQIVEFAAGANGAATPTKTISGYATGLYYLGGLALDKVNNVYAINQNSSGTFSLLGYGPTATGNMAPGFTTTPSSIVSPQAAIAVY